MKLENAELMLYIYISIHLLARLRGKLENDVFSFNTKKMQFLFPQIFVTS